MRSSVEKLYGLYERLRQEITDIGSITKDLDIFWDGDANSAYNVKVAGDLIEMGAVVMKIRDTIRCADRIFDLYMANEKEVAGMIAAFGKHRGA